MTMPGPDKKERTFSVLLRVEPEGGFTVRVPALPEIVTYGKDEEEAVAMAKEAIELSVESRTERGEEVPDNGIVLVRSVTITIPG